MKLENQPSMHEKRNQINQSNRMLVFSRKLNKVAISTNSYLKKIFSKQKKKSYLLKPMKYGIFSGGKRFR